MSKIIKMTQGGIEELCREFEATLRGIKLSDGKISFTKTFNNVDRKATLYFTEVAFLKQLALVREFDKEVAWHGVAKRCPDQKDAYIISDILVYPQEVTGATVNTNQQEYQNWLMSRSDEIFNHIRMQGHSHVNMSTSPSSVDISLYDRILEQLDDDMFYIFLIWNKKNEKTIKIYDLQENILFETADITVKILDDEIGLEKFVSDAKNMVRDKVYPTQIYYPQNYYMGQSENFSLSGKSISKSTTKKRKRKKKKEESSSIYNYGTDWSAYYSQDDDLYCER